MKNVILLGVVIALGLLIAPVKDAVLAEFVPITTSTKLITEFVPITTGISGSNFM